MRNMITNNFIKSLLSKSDILVNLIPYLIICHAYTPRTQPFLQCVEIFGTKFYRKIGFFFFQL